MIKKLLTILALVSISLSAAAQPGPVPGPWSQTGSSIFPVVQSNCLTFPLSVSGGCQGPGSANYNSLFIGGVPVTSAGTLSPSTAITGISNGFVLFNNGSHVGGVGTNGTGNVLLSAGTAAIASGKTLTANNTLTLAGTDSSTLNIGTGGTLGTAAFHGSSITVNGTSCSLDNTCSPTAVASSIALGIPLTGGTSGRVVYDNGSTVGELPVNGTGNVLLSAGTAAIASGKTLTASNTLTLAGTDSSTLNIGTGGTLGTAAFVATGTSGATVPLLNGANTWSSAQAFISTVTTLSATATPSGGTCTYTMFTSGMAICGGTGAPTVSAPKGSMYIDNAAGIPYYNNNGTTGWTSLGTGTGTVGSGTSGQVAVYASSGTTVTGATALPNGVTATTQAALDNSTKVATTAYVDTAVPGASSVTQCLLSNVAVPTANTYATGASTGSIGASGQIWFISGYTTYFNSGATNMTASARIAKSGTQIANSTGSMLTGFTTNIAVNATTTLSGATTFTLDGTDTVGSSNGLMLTSTTGVANQATCISAVRLK